MTKLSNNNLIDLHLHSTYSEGACDISQLIKLIKKYPLKVVSLTDHNTVAGTAEMIKAGQKHKIKVITGIEFYTHYQNFDLHILGYNFDYQNKFLQRALAKLAKRRLIDIKHSLKFILKQGFKINQPRLFKTSSCYIGFGQIISELYRWPENVKKIQKEMGTAEPNFFYIIKKYFGKKTPAYLPETSLATKLAIDLIHRAGGLAVLAHPAQQLGWNHNIVEQLKKIGLDGLELLSPYHHWHDIEYWQNVAKNLKLIVTGGSDFHSAVIKPAKAIIKVQWDYFEVPYSIYNQLQVQLNKYPK